MSGLLGGITKVFTSVVDGIGRVGSAMTAVGATAFTGAAATGSLSTAISSAASSGSSVLGNIFSGIGNTLGLGPVGAMTAAAGAPVAGAVKGLGAALEPGALIDTGLATAATPTGLAATGMTGFGDKITDFLSSENGGNLLQGIGAGIAGYGEQQAAAERDAALYAHQDAQEQRIRDSYHVPADVYAGNSPSPPDHTHRPTPGGKFDRTRLRYIRGRGVVETAA